MLWLASQWSTRCGVMERRRRGRGVASQTTPKLAPLVLPPIVNLDGLTGLTTDLAQLPIAAELSTVGRFTDLLSRLYRTPVKRVRCIADRSVERRLLYLESIARHYGYL